MNLLSSLLLAVILQYTSPVNFPISLAGNFGEPRPNHFHGGIDVRTELSVGKPIFSIGEGYVWRLTVNMYGFGNALYVRHPDGHTSVYCHLKGFVPSLRTEVSKYRKDHGQRDRIDEWHNPSDPLDIYFQPKVYPVAPGQLIAISGNTGSSVAPHLHLELHDTRTWAMLDPMDYLKQFMNDSIPPQAHAFMVYPQQGQGVFGNSTRKQLFGFISHDMNRVFTAWGKVGFGIWANDYMENNYHHYGIRRTQLLVDGKVVFESNVDSIPANHNRMVNAWGDFEHFRRSNVWYMKSFIEPGNRLPILHANANRGIVDFCEERIYQLTYLLTDVYGNQSQYTFLVRGVRQPIPQAPPINVRNLLYWNRVNNIQLPGMQLVVQPGLLANDIELHPHVLFQQGKLSDAYCLNDRPLPLFAGAKLSLRLKKKILSGQSLCIKNGSKTYPATIEGEWATAEVRDLGGTFEIVIDKNATKSKYVGNN